MKAKLNLPTPTAETTCASQCRDAGIKVGDTIERRYNPEGAWRDVRATLLWHGISVCVWMLSCWESDSIGWDEPEEMEISMLEGDWYKLPEERIKWLERQIAARKALIVTLAVEVDEARGKLDMGMVPAEEQIKLLNVTDVAITRSTHAKAERRLLNIELQEALKEEAQ